jgi:8-oxo-dGTP pyrophosphatase MutT (NUDIX family)
MRRDPFDPEMRRHFEGAERIPVAETALRRPPLRASAESLRAHFASPVGRAQAPLDNPHVEPRVSPALRARAVAASVLIAVALREPEPTVLVTRRHHRISLPGHWVFPGGRAEPQDSTPLETALREAEEEIGLDRRRVEVLGRLGDYVSHGGFRIAPTVALVEPPFELVAQPGEVEAIAEVGLGRLLDSSSYFLYRFRQRRERAHFALEARPTEILLTGVTASICIGLYSELSKTHASSSG